MPLKKLSMRFGKFNIEEEGKCYILQRKEYPRVNLKIDNSVDMPTLKDIEVIDECSGEEIASILTEAQSFISDLALKAGKI